MNVEIDRAIIEFNHLTTTDKTIFHKFSHWELLWSYALKCDWDQCIKYSELLRQLTRHSPVICTYCEGVFRYFKSYETNDKKLKAEATELFKLLKTIKNLIYIFKLILFCYIQSCSLTKNPIYWENNDIREGMH